MTAHEEHLEHTREIESDSALRAMAIESLLIDKGLLTAEMVDRITRVFEEDIGPMNGAKVVAHAWTDPAFGQRLLDDGNVAIAELGFSLPQKLVVLENSAAVHNVFVCTLCSCYPWTVLGLPPSWYKSPEYRSKMVIAPREVLREFGLELPETTEIRVWDSTAETRYMVLPERPPNTNGWTEEQLASIVTRDAMTGVAVVPAPAQQAYGVLA
jgi:nitrile hydratase subunit alpha